MFNITCNHELGWPRKAVTGETYRVCSKCTRKYEVSPETWQPVSKARVFTPAAKQTARRVEVAGA
jgi:hypothetical protein